MIIRSAIVGASLLVFGVACGGSRHSETASTNASPMDGLTAPTVTPAASTRVIEVVTASQGGATNPAPDVLVGIGSSMQTTGPDGRVSIPTPQGDQTPLVFQASGFLTFETLVRNGGKFNVRPRAQGDVGYLVELHQSIIRSPDPGLGITIALDPAIWSYTPGRSTIDQAKDQLAADLGIAISVTSEPASGTLVRMSLDPSVSKDTGGLGSCDAVNYIVQSGTIRVGDLDYLSRGENSVKFVFHELLHAVLCFGHTTEPGIMNPATMYSGPLADPRVEGAITTMARGGRIPGTRLDAARGLETDRVLGGSARASHGPGSFSDPPPTRR